MTDQELATLCAESTSFSQVVNKLGYSGGSGFAAVKQRIMRAKIDVSHFTGQCWNKGLTKQNHTSIEQYAKAISLSLKGRSGHPVTLETRKKLSESRSKFLATHSDHGLKWYEVQCGKNTVNVQGTWEKRVAEWLNASNIRWTRESLRFAQHRRYTPDFFLPEFNFYIEVKGFWRDRDVHKMYLVLDDNNVDIRCVDKTNINDLSIDLPKFTERFSRSSIDTSKFKDVWSSDVMAAM